jgi:hypothetical protein
MGEVYRADDLVGQAVALKFLPRSIGDDAVRRGAGGEVRWRQVSHQTSAVCDTRQNAATFSMDTSTARICRPS